MGPGVEYRLSSSVWSVDFFPFLGSDPIQGTYEAFVARMSDGSVLCWGNQSGS